VSDHVGLPEEVRRAYQILGLAPGVSPLKARRRYLQLVREWHPDRHPKDPASQAQATERTQQITGAYRTVKEAARHGEVPLRRPRAWRPGPAGGTPTAVVDTTVDRAVRFIVGALFGVLVDFQILSDSVIVWVGVPVALGTIVAIFGWRVLEWIIKKLWWLW
jgi:hypothetical protein